MRRLRTVVVIAGGLILVALAYSPSLRCGFVYDDRHVIVNAPLLRSWEKAGALLDSRYFRLSGELGTYRPVLTLSYMIDRTLWDYNPVGFHTTNLALHVVNVLLLWWLVRRVTPSARLAWVTAVAFGLHPVATEAVCAVGFREDVLGTFFCLASVCVLGGSGRGIRAAAAVVCYGLALFTKENTLLWPVVVAAASRGLCRAVPKRRIRALMIGYAIVSLAFLIVRFGPMYRPLEQRHGFEPGTLTRRLLSAPTALLEDLRLLVLPVHLRADYGYRLSDFGSSGLALVIVAAAACVVVWMAGGFKRLETQVAMLWLAATLLPVMNLLPIGSMTAERFLYFPLGGWAILLGLCFSRAAHRSRWPTWPLLATWLVCSGALCTARCHAWRSDGRLWRETIQANPGSYVAWNGLGLAYKGAANLRRAEGCFLRAVAINELHANAQYNMGNMRLAEKQFEAAAGRFRAAIRGNPNHAQAHVNLAVALLELGRPHDAIEECRKALAIDPGYALAHAALDLCRSALSTDSARP